MTLDFQKTNNKKFYGLFHDKHRYQVLKGGAGSGKSHYAAQKLIYRCLTDKIKHKMLVVRKTQPAVRDSAFALIDGYLKNWQLPHRTIDLKIELNSCVLLFKGLDDPEKIKSIEGITAIWIEEATELTPTDFRQLDLRLRGEIETYKQIILSFNPIGGKSSWLYKRFFDVKSDDARIHHSTWRDNRFIDEDYAEKAIQTGDATFKKIYDLGEWAELRNAIYSNYEKASLDVADILRRADHIYGCDDFGFNDPSVFLLIAEIDTDVYILKEIYEKKLTNAEFIEKIKELLMTVEERVNKNIDTDKEDRINLIDIPQYADSAEPARIKEFIQNGIPAKPADKKVKDGIDELKRRKIIINTECVHSCEEIPLYSYKEDKDGNVLEDPVKYNDHTLDAIRYGVYSESKKGIIFYAA